MIDIRDMYRALCRIEYREGNKEFKGQGAFIAPNMVLTAWHVLQGMKRPVFINSEGKKSFIKKGGRHLRDTASDLAMAELEDPIGTQTLLLPTDIPQYPNPEGRGFLVTRFNNAASKHKVSLIDLPKNVSLHFTDRDGGNEKDLALFDCEIQLRPGYSGSPVIDRVGRVFSVVSAISADTEDMKKTIRQHGGVQTGGFHFMGTRPQDLKSFAEVIKARIG